MLVQKEPILGAAPCYSSVVRFMKVQGLIKRQRRGPLNSPGAQASEHRIETREIRSYESQYVLQKLIQQYATTGLPPAYLPKY